MLPTELSLFGISNRLKYEEAKKNRKASSKKLAPEELVKKAQSTLDKITAKNGNKFIANITNEMTQLYTALEIALSSKNYPDLRIALHQATATLNAIDAVEAYVNDKANEAKKTLANTALLALHKEAEDACRHASKDSRKAGITMMAAGAALAFAGGLVGLLGLFATSIGIGIIPGSVMFIGGVTTTLVGLGIFSTGLLMFASAHKTRDKSAQSTPLMRVHADQTEKMNAKP